MNICHISLLLFDNTSIMEEGRKVIHLIKDGKDYYFGSLSALFSYFDEDLGITYGSIRNYGLSPEKPYQNKIITIKEGVLITAKGNRGKNNK